MIKIRHTLFTVLAGASLAVCTFSDIASAQDLMPRENSPFTYHRYPRYRPSESHPVRTLAYLMHPIGWVINEAIYRPMSSFMGSTEFNRSFFGFREPYDYREPECFF